MLGATYFCGRRRAQGGTIMVEPRVQISPSLEDYLEAVLELAKDDVEDGVRIHEREGDVVVRYTVEPAPKTRLQAC